MSKNGFNDVMKSCFNQLDCQVYCLFKHETLTYMENSRPGNSFHAVSYCRTKRSNVYNVLLSNISYRSRYRISSRGWQLFEELYSEGATTSEGGGIF